MPCPCELHVNRISVYAFLTTVHVPGEAGEIFTGALYNIYAPPPGHCYDINCNDAPIMDDKRLRDYNVEEKVG